MKLIVGLGNPGGEYEGTRHNLGFLVVRALADSARLGWKNSRLCRGLIAEGMVADKECGLLLPTTFMNNSGLAVHACCGKKGIVPGDVLVVCDDFHLDFGQLRIRPVGSDGGHNGLSSVIQALGTRDFARLRVGIGPLAGPSDAVDFVLSKFSPGEKRQLGRVVEESAACCVTWLTDGIQAAMNIFNKKEEGK